MEIVREGNKTQLLAYRKFDKYYETQSVQSKLSAKIKRNINPNKKCIIYPSGWMISRHRPLLVLIIDLWKGKNKAVMHIIPATVTPKSLEDNCVKLDCTLSYTDHIVSHGNQIFKVGN